MAAGFQSTIDNHKINNCSLWLGLNDESGELDTSGEKKVRTEGLWVKCESCRQIIWKKDLEENLNVCPKCDKHFRIDARTRLAQLARRQPIRSFRRQHCLRPIR